jgi:hypothetical protein
MIFRWRGISLSFRNRTFQYACGPAGNQTAQKSLVMGELLSEQGIQDMFELRM